MKKLIWHIPLIYLVLLAGLISPTGTFPTATATERVSVASAGDQANNSSVHTVAQVEEVYEFGPPTPWTTNPYYGSRGTFFADVDGDYDADAIVVNDDGIHVRRSDGSVFGDYERWTTNAFFGSRGTFFADVNHDRKADAIAVKDTGIWVRRSTGDKFNEISSFTSNPDYGSRGIFFTDVTGDYRADAILVDDDGIHVRRSIGGKFGDYETWTTDPYYGSRGTFFADVTGDYRADAIAVNDDRIWVRRYTRSQYGEGFGDYEILSNSAYYGSRGTFFARVNRCGPWSAIAVNDTGILVRSAAWPQPFPYRAAEDWTGGPYYGSRGNFFADVNGDFADDAIIVNDNGITVRLGQACDIG